MDKLQYDSFYKFIVSVGIVLIVIILLTNIVLNKVKKELCKNDK